MEGPGASSERQKHAFNDASMREGLNQPAIKETNE